MSSESKQQVNDDSAIVEPSKKMAYESMSKEQLLRYERLGKFLYESISFPDAKVINQMKCPTDDEVAYIIEGLKSGLHPSFLEDSEKVTMETAFGREWYKRFDYTEEDLETIK